MRVSDWIRKARFDPKLIKLAKLFNIHKYIKRMYCLFALRINKKIKVVLLGYPAEFYVNSLEELLFIEGTLIDIRQREIDVLKKIFEVLGRGDVAYDIGASMGSHTVFMAQRVGKEGCVIAFEPRTNNYKELMANINLNSLKNVTPINVAVGRHSGKESIYGYSEDSFGLFSIIRHKDDRYIEEVELVAGDVYIQDKHLPFPNVVKFDVEGYEYYVIQGLKETLMQEKCRLVFCEIHPTLLPKEVTSEDVISLLRSFGFNKVETYLRGDQIHTFCYKSNIKFE